MYLSEVIDAGNQGNTNVLWCIIMGRYSFTHDGFQTNQSGHETVQTMRKYALIIMDLCEIGQVSIVHHRRLVILFS